MQDDPIPGDSPCSQPDTLERAALELLLDPGPGFCTLAELALELGEADIAVEDTVAALTRCGLVNRWERFVAPSRAALRFDELGC